MLKSYDYGSSVISSDLKYEFNNNNSKYKKIDGEFHVELKIYCDNKKMYQVSESFNNVTIDYAIKKVFQNKIEKKVIFHKGYKYYATFKVYENKPIRRPLYKKTNTYINTVRRKYLLQERINIYF